MKKCKDTFGNGYIDNIYTFLRLEQPSKSKYKEKELYNSVMQKTGIAGLNKNQNIWIADRYLTYRYLDILKYGNFDKIKEQVNKDINNIKKVTIFDKLKSTKKIILKEAYDLYKMQIKFEEFISKVKSGELDINEFKLLVTGASFIFNFYKNKNQYMIDIHIIILLQFMIQIQTYCIIMN